MPSHMLLRTILGSALAVALASCGSGRSATPPAGSAPIPQTDQLRASDVPSGFYRAGTARLSPGETAQSEGVNSAQYVSHGGGASLTERFVPRAPNGLGLTFIFSQVLSFASPADAIWGFRTLHAALARSGTIGTVQEPVNVAATATPLPTIINLIKHPVPPPPTPYQPERVPPLGNEDVGFTNTSAAYAGEYVFTNQLVLFRRGRFCAVVHISGNYNQVPLSAALALARRIDGRIGAAASSSRG